MATKPTAKKTVKAKPAGRASTPAVPAKSGAKPAPPPAKKATATNGSKNGAMEAPARPKAVAPPAQREPAPPPPAAPAPVLSIAPAAEPKPAVPADVPITAAVGALTLSVQTSAGAAANGNTQPANILVIVTSNGTPLTELSKDHFTLMEHFDLPGQQSTFSNNITSFRNAGTGAYLLQTKPIGGGPWRSGHHLAQLLVTSPQDRQGHAALKIMIR